LKAVNNRYRLVKCLRRGVVSNLYLARDLSKKRRVVLKTIKMAGLREEITGYFRHSFLQASRLVHPNLARIYDFGEMSRPKKGQTSRFSLELLETLQQHGSGGLSEEEAGTEIVPEEDEICFFAIEYLRGQNLFEATEGEPDWPRLYGYLAQVCQALDYIHARGVTHYAIKPSNLMIVDEGGRPIVKLTDLGIAPPNPMTREAYLQGAAEYLAPEIFLGAATDRRVDLYALGVSLYQVITRELPFKGSSPAALAAAHLSQAPAPFDASLGVPPGLERLVFRLLAKDPAERYPRVRALLDAVSELSGERYTLQERTGGLERLLAGRFVGREAECKRLLQKPRQRPSCVLVEGPAGSGKTHLIREISGRMHQKGRSFFWGFFYSSPALFHRPFAEILWQMGQKLGWKGRLLERFQSDLAALVPHMLREDDSATGLSATAASERIRLFENISRFMLEFSREHPSVVHIENVHLADSWGVQFLEHLVRALGEARGPDGPDLTIILTGRIGVRSSVLEVLRGLSLENLIDRVCLEPLGPEDVSELVASLLGMEQPPTQFGRRVWEIGRGNPLYVKEVVRLLVEEGRLFFEDHWKIDAPDPQALELTGELKEILRRRLNKLGERAREALILLALLERPVNLTGAIPLLRWDAHVVVQALHELRGRKILFEDNVQGDLIYHFRHELLRDVALESLSSEELDHYREAMFTRMPELAEVAAYPEELAWFARRSDCAEICLTSARRARRLGHAARAAAEYARADEGLGQDLGRRLACRSAWARALLEDDQPQAALRVLQGVSELLEGHTSDAAVECRLMQIWVHTDLGQLAEAREVLEQSEALFARATDPLQIGELRFLRAGLDWVQSGVDPSEAYDNAMATLERAGDRLQRTEVRARLLINRFFLWGHPRAEVLLARALGERETGLRGRRPGLLRALAEHDLAYGDYAASLEHFQAALEAAEATEDYREVVASVIGLGWVFCMMGDVDKARHYAEHASELARQWRDEMLAAHACFLEGRIELLIGRTEGAYRTFEQAVDWYQSARAERKWCYAAVTTLNAMLLWSGHQQRASRWSQVAAEYRGQGYACDTEAHDYFCIGMRKLMAGDWEEAVVQFEAGLVIARGGLIVEAGWRLRYGLARTRQAMGDLDGARREIDESERIIRDAAERVPANLRETYLRVWFRQEVLRYRDELSGHGAPAEGTGEYDQSGELERVVQEYRDEIEGLQLGQLREVKGNLEKLLEINKKINSELNVEKLLEQIMDHAIELTRAERGVLLLAENGDLVYRMARDYQKRPIPDAESAISRSIAEQVIRDGRALVTTNAQEDQRLDAYQSVSDLQLHSVLCVPLRDWEKQFGALYIDNRFEKGVFTEGDRQLLEAFADQAAIALSNAWLHAENRQRAEDLSISNKRIEGLNEQLEAKVEHQSAEIVEIREELREKQSELELKYNYQNMIGQSDTMQAVFRLLDKVTDSTMPVYIHGESGTGKELVARAIHFNGPRRNHRFVVENCAALTESLLESELFGYVKGAFTGADKDKKGLFELADGGTIFFDEVGDMSHEMQKKLLRVLQEGEVRRVGGKDLIQVDARIVSASNKDLQKMVADGTFREDLYYRLNVLRLDLPPLRDRKDDILFMVDLFLDEFAEINRKPKRQLSADVEAALCDYHWPGNVRELRNVVIGVVSLTDKQVLTGADFSQKMPQEREQPTSVFDKLMSIDQYTRYFIENWQGSYNDTELAKLLGVSRKTLWEKRKKFGISK